LAPSRSLKTPNWPTAPPCSGSPTAFAPPPVSTGGPSRSTNFEDPGGTDIRDRPWVAVHLLQLSRVALMLAALTLLSRRLVGGPPAEWIALATTGPSAYSARLALGPVVARARLQSSQRCSA